MTKFIIVAKKEAKSMKRTRKKAFEKDDLPNVPRTIKTAFLACVQNARFSSFFLGRFRFYCSEEKIGCSLFHSASLTRYRTVHKNESNCKGTHFMARVFASPQFRKNQLS